ncbi:uncharacterized protein LOC115218298 [Octopus sinensis]|uniref:Uncharacterized protein LOC115218298 n=1 Tax=Octopus sinensis TaxID=2607531 RepID=A0A6P7SZV2_9MOLL|nr:uncharacterized protein LOC115218298 [Octopus sinensis]
MEVSRLVWDYLRCVVAIYCVEKAGHALVRERIHYNCWKKYQLNNEIKESLSSLFRKITRDDDRKRIQQDLEKSYMKEFEMVKTRQIKKLMKLKGQRMKTEIRHPPVKAVINVSSRHLESSEEAVLNKGLKFATTIKRIPYLDIIVPIEEIAIKIPKAQGDELRWNVRQVLEKAKLPKPNITKEEKFAIKRLQSDNSNIILTADKRNAAVVMNKSDYSEKFLKKVLKVLKVMVATERKL